MNIPEMEKKIDELIDELAAANELLERLRGKIQEEYDIANYEENDGVMDVLRRIMYDLEGNETELVG